jgi:hypothetical protein
MRASAFMAFADQLNQVRDIRVAMPPSHLVRPGFNLFVDQIGGPIANSTAEMVVVLALPAHPVSGAVFFVTDYVDFACFYQHFERSINGGQPRSQTRVYEARVDLRGSEEGVGFSERF